MCDDEVGRCQNIGGFRLVDRLTREGLVGQAGETGDPGVKWLLRILAPEPGCADLDNPAELIKTKALDGKFDDLVGFPVETCCFDVEGETNACLPVRRSCI